MKNFKGYNVIDLILILAGILAVTISGIIFKSEWYIFVNTLLALFCVLTQAKGKVITQFLGIAWFSFYVFISYKQKFYGEALVYLTVMIPLYIYGVIHWLQNRDKTDNVVIVRNNLSKKEWLISGFSLCAVAVGIFFLLKALNTAQLVVNTLSFVTMLPAVYLLMRRCKWNQIAFLVNDFIVPFLWLFLVLEGDYSFLPMCIYHVFQITYDIYGFIEWIKLEKKQAKEQINQA